MYIVIDKKNKRSITKTVFQAIYVCVTFQVLLEYNTND